jgi:hypothetical protein
MIIFTLFISNFFLVFALGLQSLNVNNGHIYAAAFTSFLIGVGNIVLFKFVPNANAMEIAAFLISGPMGVSASMLAHPKLAQLLKRKSHQPTLLMDAVKMYNKKQIQS